MLNSTLPQPLGPAEEDAAVEAVLRAGPRGAIVLAGSATAIVFLLWLAFYVLVFLARVTPP